jgi:hypothetical protein
MAQSRVSQLGHHRWLSCDFFLLVPWLIRKEDRMHWARKEERRIMWQSWRGKRIQRERRTMKWCVTTNIKQKDILIFLTKRIENSQEKKNHLSHNYL